MNDEWVSSNGSDDVEVPEIDYDRIIDYDNKIRRVMTDIASYRLHNQQPHKAEEPPKSTNIFRRITKQWHNILKSYFTLAYLPKIFSGSGVEGASLARLCDPVRQEKGIVEIEVDMIYTVGCISSEESAVVEIIPGEDNYVKVNMACVHGQTDSPQLLFYINTKDSHRVLDGKYLEGKFFKTFLQQYQRHSQQGVFLQQNPDGSLEMGETSVSKALVGPSAELKLLTTFKTSSDREEKSKYIRAMAVIVDHVEELVQVFAELQDDVKRRTRDVYEKLILSMGIAKEILTDKVTGQAPITPTPEEVVTEFDMLLKQHKKFYEHFQHCISTIMSVITIDIGVDWFECGDVEGGGKKDNDTLMHLQDQALHTTILAAAIPDSSTGYTEHIKSNIYFKLPSVIKSLTEDGDQQGTIALHSQQLHSAWHAHVLPTLTGIKDKLQAVITGEYQQTAPAPSAASATGKDVEFDIDNVPAIHLAYWPSKFNEWMTRDRKWPTKTIIDAIVHYGIDIVPKPKPKSSNDSNDDFDAWWRYSFSYSEAVIAKSRSTFQNRAYFYFKSLLYRYIKAAAVDGITLSSYIGKTVMLWCCEQVDQSWWQESSIVETVTYLFTSLRQHLLDRKLRHYFIVQVNLLDLDTLPQQLMDECVARIDQLLNMMHGGGDIKLPSKAIKIVHTVIDDMDEYYQYHYNVEADTDGIGESKECLLKDSLQLLIKQSFDAMWQYLYMCTLPYHREIRMWEKYDKCITEKMDFTNKAIAAKKEAHNVGTYALTEPEMQNFQDCQNMLVASKRDAEEQLKAAIKAKDRWVLRAATALKLGCTQCDICGVGVHCGDVKYRCKTCTGVGGYDLCRVCYETPREVEEQVHEHNLTETLDCYTGNCIIFHYIALANRASYQGITDNDIPTLVLKDAAENSNKLFDKILDMMHTVGATGAAATSLGHQKTQQPLFAALANVNERLAEQIMKIENETTELKEYDDSLEWTVSSIKILDSIKKQYEHVM